MARLVEKLDLAFKEFEFGVITRELYAFFWNEFCDWYIELSKPRLNAGGEDKLVCQRNLVFVLDQALRLLHPIMPFVTEQIYDELPVEDKHEMLMMTPWPSTEELACYINPEAERVITMVTQSVGGVRSARARYGISPKVSLSLVVKAESETALVDFEAQQTLICALANVEIVKAAQDAEKPNESAVVLAEGLEVYILLSGLVDFAAERARLEKQIAAVEKDRVKFEKKLNNPGFLSKAAPEVIEKDKVKLAEFTQQSERLKAQLAEMDD